MPNTNHGALLTWISDRRTCPDEVRRVPADRLFACSGAPTDFITQKDGFLCMTVSDEVLDDPALLAGQRRLLPGTRDRGGRGRALMLRPAFCYAAQHKSNKNGS